MAALKTTFYLYPPAAAILDALMKECNESQSSVVNAAIIFYAERGAYMEALIKRSIREALQPCTQ
jgi:hypothetical protein